MPHTRIRAKHLSQLSRAPPGKRWRGRPFVWLSQNHLEDSMIQRFFNARRFYDADKGGIAGATGHSDEAANPVSAGEENNGEGDAFLNALGFDAQTRAALAPKRTEEPKPEQPETVAKDEEDDDEAPLQAHAGNEKMLKRINKLTARAKAAEAELAALKAKPAETPTTEAKPAAKTASNADDVFAGVETHEQLTELVNQARQTEAWYEAIEARWEEQGEDAIEVPDGNGGTRTLTPQQVKAYAKRAGRILRDRADAQERIAAKEQAKAKAAARFPWLAKPETERTAAEKQAATVAEGIRANAPEFGRFPDSDYIINLLAEAIIADQAGGKPAQAEQPKAKPNVAPPPPLGVGGNGAKPAAPQRSTVTAPLDEHAAAAYFLESAA